MDIQFNIPENVKKVLKNRKFQISALTMLGVCFLATSIMVSFKNEQKRRAVPVMPQIDRSFEKEAYKEIDRSNFKNITVIQREYGRVNPFNPEENPYAPDSGILPDRGETLVAPPASLPDESPAGLVMGATISGIMYDDVNPSAIINIEGTDYFVKRNDVINNYRIMAITPTYVAVKYGKNVYRAKVGELLTDLTSQQPAIANLSTKFGGNTRDNIPIKVRKR